MKNVFLIIPVLCFAFFSANSQSNDEGVKLDLLKAPASPASNLLGIAASDVDKPTDVSAFMLSLQKASGNFTALPSNYAIDIAPYWLFKKKLGDITTEGLNKSSGTNVLKQTFVLSFAIRNTDSTESELLPNTVYGGLGFKFSIIRGEYDGQTKNALKTIKTWQDIQIGKGIDSLTEYKADPDIIRLQTKRKNLIKRKSQTQASDTSKIAELDNSILDITDELETSVMLSVNCHISSEW